MALAASLRHLAIDGALSAGGANQELMELLDRAGPYGPGHPEPRFVFPAHRLRRVRVMKDVHIRCTLHASDGARIEACAFRVADTPLGALLSNSEGLPLHVAGHLAPHELAGQGKRRADDRGRRRPEGRGRVLARVLAGGEKPFYMTRLLRAAPFV